jgi:tRNA (cytidine/uridine-2'-O-)-methyltransferase
MRLALHQPDQAGNVGTILRLAACFGVSVDVGYVAVRVRELRRAGGGA